MRLWSFHPKYLDCQGLLALWREALLAQAVLRGQTCGYIQHPQLSRFRSANAPLAAIAAYLRGVLAEAVVRGYSFNKSKIGRLPGCQTLPVNSGQLAYEWGHFLAKLSVRNASLRNELSCIETPDCHPLFHERSGGVEPWERLRVGA